MTSWPLRVRLPVIMVALLVFAELAIGSVAYALVGSTLTSQVDARLDRAAGDLASRPRDDADAVNLLQVADLPSDYVVMYHNARGELASGIQSTLRNRPAVPDVQIRTDAAGPYSAHDDTDGSAWRLLTLPSPRPRWTVTVGLPLADVSDAQSTLLTTLVVVAASTMAMGAAVAWATTRRSLRPLREAEHTAGAIASGDLSRRVPGGDDRTEAGSLARSLNAMLDRLDGAFTAQRGSEDRLRSFVSDASHELRTPLAAIQGYAELHRMGGDGNPDHAMARIESNAKRMGTLVEDLLILARYDEQPASLAGQDDVDLGALAREGAADARAQDPSRLVSVGSTGDGPDLVVRGSARHLRQVVANILANAVRHTPPGSPIELTVSREDGWAILEIRDHGPGIPASEREAVFDRFRRLDSSRARESGGSGLGLAIVRSIVTAHGGTVSATTATGGGAAIVVRLPLAAP